MSRPVDPAVFGARIVAPRIRRVNVAQLGADLRADLRALAVTSRRLQDPMTRVERLLTRNALQIRLKMMRRRVDGLARLTR